MNKNKKGIDHFKDIFKSEIINFNEQEKISNIISSGSIQIDNLLAGGIPQGIIVEIYGHEGSGKTTFALNLISSIHKIYDDQAFCCYIDAEGGICSKSYLESQDINTERLLVFKTADGEDIFNKIEILILDENCKLIVIDSIAALVSREELEEDGTIMIGSHARMISRRLKKLIACMSNCKSKTTIILINQLRSKIGQQDSWKGEFQTSTTGGKSIKYYASLRLEIERNKFILDKEKRIGMFSKVKVIKSRNSIPFQESLYPIIFGKGFSKYEEILELAILYKVLEQNGNWISFEGKSYNGRNNFCTQLKEDKNLFNKLLEHTNKIILQ